jgi:hypothetical protein
MTHPDTTLGRGDVGCVVEAEIAKAGQIDRLYKI